MEQLRFTAKPLNRQIIINIPPQMDAEVVEVLVRPSKETNPKVGRWRRPPEQLRGTVIHDDLIAPARGYPQPIPLGLTRRHKAHKGFFCKETGTCPFLCVLCGSV